MTTFVTAWVPTQRAPHTTIRQVDEYVLLARHIFTLGYPIIAFVHPEIHDHLKQLAIDVNADVQFVPTDTHTTTLDRASKIHNLILRGATPEVLTNPHRDTADYLCVQISKADWIEKAATLTSDSDLWWIDLGLAHVSPVAPNQLLGIPENAKAVVACDHRLLDQLVMMNDDERITYERNWPVAAGGMFGVRTEFAAEFRRLWWTCVDEFLDTNIAPTDELVLSNLSHTTHIANVNGIHQNLFHSFTPGLVHEAKSGAIAPIATRKKLRSLADLPSAEILAISEAQPWEPGWSTFNPSVASDRRGTMACLVRSSNYSVNGYDYSILDDSSVIKTKTQCVILDSNYSAIDSFWIEDPEIVTSDPLFPVHGIEDMRLSFDGTQWIVTGTIRQHDSQGYCRQVIAKLNLAKQQLEDVYIMPTPIVPWPGNVARVHEKNWLALQAHENRQELVWSTDPLVILEWDWSTKNLAPKRGKPALLNVYGLRGSTPFVKTPMGMLGVVHEVSTSHLWPETSEGPARRYAHRFVLIAADSDTPRISEPFSFIGEQLEYAAGLALIDDSIIISFGQNDKTAHLLNLHLSEVEKLLHA